MADFELLAPGGHQKLVDEVVDRLDLKADIDALSPLLTAGAALGITGNGPTTTAAWLQRVSTSDGPTTVKSIHGRTLRWNQILMGGNFVEQGYWNGDHSTVSIADGVLTMTPDEGGLTQIGLRNSRATPSGQVASHKYLTVFDAKVSSACKVVPVHFDIGFGSIDVTTTNVWVTVGGFATLNNVVTSPATRIYVRPITGTLDASLVTQFRNYQLFDLTAMFGAGSEPSTVAEFEALFPLPYYEYDAGSLLSVNMAGIETVGFNQWDEEWELGSYNTTNGEKAAATTRIRCKNPIPVFPDTDYYLNFGSYSLGSQGLDICFYDANGDFLSFLRKWSAALTIPAGVHYMTWSTQPAYGTTYNHDICINLSWSGRRNGEYEPYWKAEREIAVSTYFPDGMRSAGTVYDELTATSAITRIGEVDLGTLTWSRVEDNRLTVGYYFKVTSYKQMSSGTLGRQCAEYEMAQVLGLGNVISTYGSDVDKMTYGSTNQDIYIIDSAYTDAAAFKVAMSGVMLHYALATPTTVEIDPPLNMTYRTAAGGTERVIVPTGELSAPPTLVTAQSYTAESLRDAALSTIAPVENGLASTNYAVGSYLVHGGQLCRVTTAIATGEAITIGTNVTATTVMAEVIALIAQ